MNKKHTSPRFELILDKYCKIEKNVDVKRSLDKKAYSAKPVGTPKKKKDNSIVYNNLPNQINFNETEREIKIKNSNLVTDRKVSEKDNIKGTNILTFISNKINKQLINSNSTSFSNFNFKHNSKSLKSNNLPSFNNINLNNINININLDDRSLFTELSKKTSPKTKFKESQGSNFNLFMKGKNEVGNMKISDNQIILNKNNKTNSEKHLFKEVNQSLNINFETGMKKREELETLQKKIYNKSKVASKSSSRIEEEAPKFMIRPDSKRHIKEKLVEKKMSSKSILIMDNKVNKNVEKKVQSQNNSPSHISVLRKLSEKKESIPNIDNVLNNTSNLKFKEIKQKDCSNNNLVELKQSFKISLNQVNKSVDKGSKTFM
jgi:hypothetical protein